MNEQELISTRRDFHKFPESAWTEFRTSSLIAKRLEALGYKVRAGLDVINPDAVMGRPSEEVITKNIARALTQGADEYWLEKMQRYTGVIAELDTGITGPVIALRFDIDCVEVNEESQKDFASVNNGCSHSCGHDAHMTIGLGVAEELILIRKNLRGRIKLIFQPGEEGCRGAYAMTQAGAVDDVDYFLAFHIGMGLKSGVFACNSVGYLATTKFDAVMTGKPAHAAASPNEGKNALLAACHAALGLHSIAPHPEGSMRINVGTLNAGTGRNVIPSVSVMKIETRGESQKIADYVYSRAIEILEGAAKMHGVELDIIKAGESPEMQGSQELAKIAGEIVRESGIFESVQDSIHVGGSEDAAWFMNRVQSHGGKAVYMGLGSNITAPHHNGKFDIDESVMINGVKALSSIVERLSRE